MTPFLAVCPVCGTVNRVNAPFPRGKEPRCGSCHGALYAAFVAPPCPNCKREEWNGGYAPKCRICGLVAGPFPAQTILSPAPRAPKRPSMLQRLINRSAQVEFERALEQFEKSLLERQDALHRSERAHSKLMADWAEAARQTSARAREAEARAREEAARSDWARVYSEHRISELGNATGPEFERYLVKLFIAMGYEVEHTPLSGDQGADLVVWEPGGGPKLAVQAKRYKAPVGNGGVQELLGGMTYYRCAKGILVTTSDFTKSAKELAARHGGIALWNHGKLAKMHERFAVGVPPFSMEAYERLRKTLRGG